VSFIYITLVVSNKLNVLNLEIMSKGIEKAQVINTLEIEFKNSNSNVDVNLVNAKIKIENGERLNSAEANAVRRTLMLSLN